MTASLGGAACIEEDIAQLGLQPAAAGIPLILSRHRHHIASHVSISLPPDGEWMMHSKGSAEGWHEGTTVEIVPIRAPSVFVE